MRTINILGSCVVRDAFFIGQGMESILGEGESSTQQYYINKFIQSNSLLSLESNSLDSLTDVKLMPEDMLDMGKAWYKWAKINIDKSVFDTLRKSPSDFLIITLNEVIYDLLEVSNNVSKIYLSSHVFNGIGESIFHSKFKNIECKVVNVLDFVETEQGKEYLDKSLKFFKQEILMIYDPSKIILTKYSYAKLYVSKNGEIKEFDVNQDIYNRERKLIEYCETYFLKEINPIIVEVPKNSIADERHKWGLGRAHYINEIYEYLYNAYDICMSHSNNEMLLSDLFNKTKKYLNEYLRRERTNMKNYFIYSINYRTIQVKNILKLSNISLIGIIGTDSNITMSLDDFLVNYNNNNSVLIIAVPIPKEETVVINNLLNRKFVGKIVTNAEFHYKYEIPYYANSAKRIYDIDFYRKIQKWMDNFLSEVVFWKTQVATPGSMYWNHYIDRISVKEFYSNRINNDCIKEDTVILDVGCGICSQYGTTFNGKNLNIIGIDPLAYFYNDINRKYLNKHTEIKRKDVEFGMFELLSYNFSENYADYILIDNALDHCIDPVAAIIESLKVLKINGVLSTAHHVNEAYKAFYSDLHQWNIYCDENNEFVLWNTDNYISVSNMLKDYVDIEISIDKKYTVECPYGQVVCNMKKKKDIPYNLYSENKNRYNFIIREFMRKLTDIKYAVSLLDLNIIK